uniref:Uncharacterized protein n=1 Tax=Arundo donax TaxID=35708 RepID=A0A0A9I0R9_ARUDO
MSARLHVTYECDVWIHRSKFCTRTDAWIIQ